MLDMIERLLNEAELPDELSKLSVYGRTLEGLKELLTHLLSHPDTGWQLRRQVTNSVYRAPGKCLYVVARNFFLLLLNSSDWPCLGPA